MPSNFYYADISYVGTRYFGMQKQKETSKTIQGVLTSALAKVCKIKDSEKYSFIKVIPSGRTDAGVHAHQQICRFEIPVRVPAKGLLKALNLVLPDDIKIKEIKDCDESFHPRFQAKWKEYHYTFSYKKEVSPFYSPYVFSSYGNLDFSLMEKACKQFIGQYDFSFFCTRGTEVSNYTREIYHCSLSPVNVSLFGHEYEQDNLWSFQVIGGGFLKQMVRIMVGFVLKIGRRQYTLDDLQRILNTGECLNINRYVAPAKGLALHKVSYDSWKSQS